MARLNAKRSVAAAAAAPRGHCRLAVRAGWRSMPQKGARGALRTKTMKPCLSRHLLCLASLASGSAAAAPADLSLSSPWPSQVTPAPLAACTRCARHCDAAGHHDKPQHQHATQPSAVAPCAVAGRGPALHGARMLHRPFAAARHPPLACNARRGAQQRSRP